LVTTAVSSLDLVFLALDLLLPVLGTILLVGSVVLAIVGVILQFVQFFVALSKLNDPTLDDKFIEEVSVPFLEDLAHVPQDWLNNKVELGIMDDKCLAIPDQTS